MSVGIGREELEQFAAAFATMNEDDWERFLPIACRQLAGRCCSWARSLSPVYAAQDLLSETLLRAFEARSSFRPGVSLTNWLYGILDHLVIDIFRRSSAAKRGGGQHESDISELRFEMVSDQPTALAALLSDEGAAVIESTMHGLCETLRLPLTLRADGLSCAEIAEQLGITEGAVKTRLLRGRQHMRNKLEAILATRTFKRSAE